jgi:hypothetical protein
VPVAFRSVKDLIAAIGTFIDAGNDRCQPFAWTKDADELLAAITRSGPLGLSQRCRRIFIPAGLAGLQEYYRDNTLET